MMTSADQRRFAFAIARERGAPRALLDLLDQPPNDEEDEGLLVAAQRVSEPEEPGFRDGHATVTLSHGDVLIHDDGDVTLELALRDVIASGGVALETWLETVDLGYEVPRHA